MRRGTVGVLVLLCALVVVCPADIGRATGAAGDGELRALLQPSRLFETRGALRVDVSNVGDEDVRITSLRLDSPLYEPQDPQPRDPVLEAGGGTVVMPVLLGEPVCDAETAGPARLVLGVAGGEVAVPLDERPEDLLTDRHAAACAVVEVRSQADLRMGDDWERTAERTVTGEFELAQRQPGVELEVVGLEGNVIFSLATEDAADDGSPVLAVDDDHPTDAVGASITASRCDPHALIEYKRTFTFVALVDTGGETPLRVDVTAEGETRRLLEDVLQACL
jgi:hypothetical protein